MGYPIWLVCIVPNTVYDQFHKEPWWVADKRVELYEMRLDDGYIDLKIQWYEQIPGISRSDLVYRLYYENHTQVQSHTQLVHGKISMHQIYGTAKMHTSTINKIFHHKSCYRTVFLTTLI